MAGIFTWINTDGGTDDWDDPNAWQSNGITPAGPPGAGDTALIDQSDASGDPYTVTVMFGEVEAAASLLLHDTGALLQVAGTLDLGSVTSPGTLNLQYGVVQVTGTLDLGGIGNLGTLDISGGEVGDAFAGGVFKLQGGTLADATVYENGGDFLIAPPGGFSPPNHGTLDNVTVVGDLSLAGSDEITIENGLTVLPAVGPGPGAIAIGEAPFDEGQSGLDFVGTQSLSNVTITLGNFIDSAYPSYIDADDLTLEPNVTIAVVGAAAMSGTFIDDGVIDLVNGGALNLANATLSGSATIDMIASGTSLTLSQTFLGTVTGLLPGDSITIAGLNGADTAAVNANDQLVFYDTEGDALASVQLGPALFDQPYPTDSFSVTELGLPGNAGNGAEVTVAQVPTGGGPANTFEWQQAQAVADFSSDFNTAANWLVDDAAPAAGPAAGSDVDFDNDDMTYTVDGYGVVNYLSVEQDDVTFDGGLSVSNLLITSDFARVTLSTGSFALGAVSVQGDSTLTLNDGATVTFGAPGIAVLGVLTIDGSVALSGGPLQLAGGALAGVAGAGVVDFALPVELGSGGGAAEAGAGTTLVLGGPITDGASPAGLTVNGDVDLTDGANSYTQGTTIEPDATLELGASGAAGVGAIVFAPGSGETLKIDSGAQPGNTISDLAAGDVIDFAGIAGVAAATINGSNQLVLSDADGNTLYTLATTGSAAGDDFVVEPDGAGGTDVFVPGPASWTGGGGTSNDWENGANWAFTVPGYSFQESNGDVPTIADDVTFGPTSGAYAVTIASGENLAVNTLTIDADNATLAVGGVLQVNNGLTIRAIGFSLSGGPTLALNGGMVVSGGTATNSGYGAALLLQNASFIQQGGSLTNSNFASITNTGPNTGLLSGFILDGGAKLTNTSDATILNQGGGAFTNSASSLVNQDAASLTNSGLGTVFYNQDGATLTNSAFLTNQDGATLTNDATLITGKGGYVLNAVSSTVNGTGTYEQIGGVTENDGSFTQGTLELSGGIFTNNAAMTITGNLSVTGGDLVAFSAIQVDGNFETSGSGTSVLESDVAVTGTYTEGDATTLGQGGTLTAGSIDVTTGGHFTLDGGTASGQSFDLTGGTLELESGSFDLPLSAGETGTLQIDAGTTLSVSGIASSGMMVNFAGTPAVLNLANPAGFGGTFGTFGAGDTIKFASSDVSVESYTVGPDGVGVLTLDVGGTDTPLRFADGIAFNADDFTPGAGSISDTQTPCFCRGTMILTDRGEVGVEELSVGDRVVTLGGAAKPIRWIGFGRTLVTARNRCDVSPVIVRRNALAENVPCRDLHVTRRHAILVEDVLVPVEHLINGVSVMWDNAACVVEYYHIELDDHDVLVADGAPAESFRDDDSRYLFQNERCRPPRSGWAPACRPLVTQGPWLEHAWRAVAGRVGKLPEDRMTGDPGLHLLVNGRRVDPSFAAGESVRFSFDRPPSGEIALVSRSCIPHAHDLGDDLRRLGIGLVGLMIFHQGGRRAVPLSADELAAGFHEFEGHIRWTKGRAVLPASLFAGIGGAVGIELQLAADLRYPRDLDELFGPMAA